MDEVLARADVVNLGVSLHAGTRGLIGQRELSLMKPDAILINGENSAVGNGGDFLSFCRYFRGNFTKITRNAENFQKDRPKKSCKSYEKDLQFSMRTGII